ncbi:hypothetical protein HPB50_019053 [Hyalomma asiaticum]|uniref:Uncharacterized protein n=1 Tax=Hyalomma asiaticum TaxID=266040 RepID=A0ACB7TKX4_HYAAI|nr:hypothetical protein HPB50_019053 [Hyalomma asiaticum]
MPGIVWQNLDPVTMSHLGVDLMREELARRQLDITGSKEELFQRLQADIQQQREATPSVETNESASTAAAPLTLDPAILQSLAMLFQQIPRPATTVTTLSDLSSSIPQFAERQQSRSEQSTPQSSRGATPKTRISELPAEQQEATYAAISAQYGAPAFHSGQDLSQAVCYQCHALGHLVSKCPTRTSRLSSSTPPTLPKTQQPPALHSAPVTLDGSQQQCPFFNVTLSGVGPVPKTAYNVILCRCQSSHHGKR